LRDAETPASADRPRRDGGRYRYQNGPLVDSDGAGFRCFKSRGILLFRARYLNNFKLISSKTF